MTGLLARRDEATRWLRLRQQEPVTAQDRALRWVLSLPRFTWFRCEACPEPAADVVAALDELLAARYPPVTRYAENLYRREPCYEHHLYGRGHSLDYVATRIGAPPVGSGLAGPSAMLALGVSNQVPVATHVAVTDPAARPPDGLPAHHRHRYEYRDNERRNELTWHEVTLLEAVRGSVLWERMWPLEWNVALSAHLKRITSLDRQLTIGAAPLIRRDRFKWAAEVEPSLFDNQHADSMAQVLHEVLGVLPEVLDEPALRRLRERRLRRMRQGWFSRLLDRWNLRIS